MNGLQFVITFVLVVTSTSGLTELDLMGSEDLLLVDSLAGGWEENWRELYLVDVSPEELHNMPRIGHIEDVEFFLWTRANQEVEYVIEAFSLESIANSPFNPQLHTYFLLHGFSSNGKTTWVLDAKTELLNKYDCNIISVDYRTLVRPPFYVSATTNVYKTANLTAHFIDWLHSDVGLSLQNIHMSGHSLGAHVVGMAGHYVTTGEIARITGLDPAGPLFEDQDVNHTISKSSATFVDIIHANGGSFLQGCLGIYRELGHADFYPNGGRHQVGCVRHNDSTVAIADFDGCSHHRSVLYWIESIQYLDSIDESFFSWPCSSWESYVAGECYSCAYGCSQMGLPSIAGAHGKYYLHTHEQAPYHQGNEH